MKTVDPQADVLSREQLAYYREVGAIGSIDVLTAQEVEYYQGKAQEVCEAFGVPMARLDGLHLYFTWAWALCSHPGILDCIGQLLGPNIIIESSRLFFKYPDTESYVAWHQDGYTQKLTEERAPTIWLGLTQTTPQNGCLQVIPGSHLRGPLNHFTHQDLAQVVDVDDKQKQRKCKDNDNDLSRRIAVVPEGYEAPLDITLKAGQMSMHHPLCMHGSNPNRTSAPRIGVSVSYSSVEARTSRWSVACGRGHVPADYPVEILPAPTSLSFDEAFTNYRRSAWQKLPLHQ
jgi:non-heme Fe2+,alpha-ketoglutarate-dependent halogenase